MILKLCMALSVMMSVHVSSFPAMALTQQQVPAYAKWGRMAIEETKKKYPNVHIIDYLHEGSELNGDSTTEKFKLWIKDGNREFGVYVRIKYTTESEKVVNIDLQETDR